MARLFLRVFLAALIFFITGCHNTPKLRSAEFTYEVVIEGIPENSSELKLWLPSAPVTAYQRAELASQNAIGRPRFAFDKTYHNKIIYYSFKSPQGTIKIGLDYNILRYEYSGRRRKNKDKEVKETEGLNKYLTSNRLMVVNNRIKQMAAEITKGKITASEKARAIYDYVLENVSYDKTKPGWGRGDTLRVCIIKAGNCTDFHSLFVSLARASGIPAQFVIGFLLPKEKEGLIKSYHCWAEFYDAARGWVPVDISQAWQDKPKKEYYFGSLDENRIEFSRGRDIVLEPSANSGPLNYFIYPYAQVDGKRWDNVKVFFRFRDGRAKKQERDALMGSNGIAG